MTLRHFAVSALALPALFLTLIGPAQARPGGGHSYSGSHSSHSSPSHSSPSHSSPSHSSGSHSSSGSGYHPPPPVYRPSVSPVVPITPNRPARPSDPAATGLGCGCMLLMLLIFVALIVFIIWMIKRSKTSAPPSAPPPPQPLDLDVLRTLDPDFSAVLFLDFAYALYARAHQARANRQALDALSPYLSPEVRASLAAREPSGVPVAEVVIGALRVVGIELPSSGTQPAQVRVRLEIESNLTLGDAGSERTQYAAESWTLVRGAGVRTKPPQEVTSFHCPNCGAPFASSGSDRCEYCGEVVSNGRFDWTVIAADLDGVEDAPPALTGTVEEEGTDLPTIYHPQARARRAELLQADPATTDQALAARLQLIYTELNTAWTNLDLRPIRPYVSDSLFDYLQYWIDAYNRQGLRNVLQGMRLTGLEEVKIVRDRWFDAVTFRIRATGRDTTVRQATGELVGGRPDRDRQYSEYWTLIRGAGVKGAPRADKSCPNCGAALEAADVNQAGQCAHCGARITRGDFDWVLSRIEQDESYTG